MKTYFFICIFLISTTLMSNAQVLDVAPSGRQNIRAVEGGGELVSIDTKTPLNDLIQRFEKPWQFVETGKGYWIGYTNDMYSIAAYKDKAIPLLVNFIDTTKNLNARLGGLYTLHLIGINSQVIGRFIEDFSDKKAREAILKYLNDPLLNETVVSLLMRDPWLSDIPLFMDYLSKPGKDYSKVISALVRYDFDGKPIWQEIDKSMITTEVPVSTMDTNQNSGLEPIYSLLSYQKFFGDRFVVDTEISNSSNWIEGKEKLSKMKFHTMEPFGFYFYFILGDDFNYCEFQSSYFYTFNNHKLTLYGPIKTRQIWLDWWSKLDDKKKNQFVCFSHLPIEERFKKK